MSLSLRSKVVAVATAGVLVVAGAVLTATGGATSAAPAPPPPKIANETVSAQKLTKTQKKTERARFIVAVPKIKGAKVSNAQAWVGDMANGGVKAKVKQLKTKKGKYRYRVTVPVTREAVRKRGATFSYRVIRSNGVQQWRTKGIAVK